MANDDLEISQLALLALRNSFWKDFSALCNTYLTAAEGLDVTAQEMQMGELTSIYGRDVAVLTSDIKLRIWTVNTVYKDEVTYHPTMEQALQDGSAAAIYVQNKKVFERRDTGWYYVGGYMTEREEFEAWFSTAYSAETLQKVENGCYTERGAGMAWDAWQAARTRRHSDKPRDAMREIQLSADRATRLEAARRENSYE
jgi:hypothetical protein